jgi:hypothetical protein
VRWHLRYKLSFRDLAEMMAERGLSLAHTTIIRWVKRFTPERDCTTRCEQRMIPGVMASSQVLVLCSCRVRGTLIPGTWTDYFSRIRRPQEGT